MNTKDATREERKKEKELNEARKAGKVEALKDEEGNDINPHMPQYIIKAPWYLNQTKPGLKHQRYRATEKVKIEEERNKKIVVKNKKSVQEFCRNCGSIAHTEKYCLQRTRKKKIDFMNRDNDDDFLCVTQDLGYDGNRDRWVGYNPNTFDNTYREYEKIVEEKKKRKAEELKKKYEREPKRGMKSGCGDDDGFGTESDDAGDVVGQDDTPRGDDAGQDDTPGGDPSIDIVSKNEKNRNIARNLRIREDTAKYLYNLSLNSAFYDPKSRSMREDPFSNVNKNLENIDNYYKGENYYNNTDDAIETKKLEIFAWETYKRGENVHFNAQPTQLELLYREFLKKKKNIIKKKQEDILKTYKCEIATKGSYNDEELIHSEIYTEYKSSEHINKNTKRIKVLSKYEEDIYPLDHTSIFGSFYDRVTQKWGYKCCQCTDKFKGCFQT
ncbi:pre-mRNA-splicing factor SLU7, putative (SLU7) [Plasmodium ovale wallikeri]|uniref:Pre-mRNA-splicing factor SLU7 n=1 Tax=Plasmodium ovale wallikeri TaxID=864142 RepID=A0A1A8Z4S3_PLAOA|nr:pre-mRNA-splicing factor SLU7, putative (SLU7) [Plasmodium ovale wallikeri]